MCGSELCGRRARGGHGRATVREDQAGFRRES
jgi:hypothetical protein